jgi:hypothetical protein
MSQSTTMFTPVPDASLIRGATTDRLGDLFTRELLDVAMDRAARHSRATVAVFAAAPVECPRFLAAIEFVVEFFVPPTSMEMFHRELEAQLLLLSPGYVSGRYRGEFAACALHNISSGTFHQYRITCRASAADQRQSRWSRDRLYLDGVLHQDRTGWRELGS